jgi:hypothetical protein
MKVKRPFRGELSISAGGCAVLEQVTGTMESKSITFIPAKSRNWIPKSCAFLFQLHGMIFANLNLKIARSPIMQATTL